MNNRHHNKELCSAGELPPCQVILNMLPSGLIMVDSLGVLRTWNRAMEQLTGYAAEEVLGGPCTVLGCDSCETTDTNDTTPQCRFFIDASADKANGEIVEQTECGIRSKDGKDIPVLRKACVVKDENGHFCGIIETLTDLRAVKKLERNLAVLQGSVDRSQEIGRLVGTSNAMRYVYERIQLAAQSFATVLIRGETGTGKELVAEAIHEYGPRHKAPFVKVNCSALPENLLESELFGHVKGAFTGAIDDKVGRFEAAEGGTIFLDEIGDLSPLIQLKLLRVLQEREFERVGESTTRKVDVRVICATHRNLHELVQSGEFREDLYYRIRVFPIDLPPLRERKTDIPRLVETYIERFNKQTGKHITGITNEVLHCFMEHCWPGNVRELENAIEHAYVTCEGNQIELFDLPPEVRMVEWRNAHCSEEESSRQDNSSSYQNAGRIYSAEQLRKTLEECGWNRSEAARSLGVNRTTVWRKMKQWGLHQPVR
ncbi:MAG: sigma-54 interaction domain-containing protein [Lentisphaeria bacterium]